MDNPKKDKVLLDALRAANRVRRFLGLPPVKELYGGEAGYGSACPITNTIYDDDLDRDSVTIVTRYSIISVYRKGKPEKNYLNYGNLFVSAFDAGHYPELSGSSKRLRLID